MSSTWTAVAGSLTEQRLHADVGQQPECEQRILAAFLAGYQGVAVIGMSSSSLTWAMKFLRPCCRAVIRVPSGRHGDRFNPIRFLVAKMPYPSAKQTTPPRMPFLTPAG